MKIFTGSEIRDIVISIVLISSIFWIYVFNFPDLVGLFTSIVIVFFSFFCHEMLHEFVAKKLGCMATYKLWPMGILLGIMSIVLGLIGLKNLFIPIMIVGATEIMPYRFGRWGFKVVKLSARDLGIIAIAGTGLNVFFAVFFKLFSGPIFHNLSYFNGLFALFNLIPIPPLDGSKIFLWKMWLWLFLVFVTVLSIFSSIGFI
jgi:Zn-dependent protease